MNLSWLDDFLALAATGNFSRAADERHMTQPAFGRRVKALEEWLGADLFDRRSQPVRLTPTGEWFRSVAVALQAQVARVPGEARAVAEAQSNSLRFAVTHALSLTFMPAWLRRLEAHTLHGNLQLQSDMQQRCELLLEQSKVQFVICHSHPSVPSRLQTAGFASLPIGDDVLIPVSAADALGAALYRLTDTSTPVPLLTYSAESGFDHILRETRYAALADMVKQTPLTAHLASVLRTMALDGRGIAWLPQSLIADDLAAGRLLSAAAPSWSVDLEIRLFRDRVPMGQAAEALWAVLQSAAERTPLQKDRHHGS